VAVRGVRVLLMVEPTMMSLLVGMLLLVVCHELLVM
jgi:hypothetical protein